MKDPSNTDLDKQSTDADVAPVDELAHKRQEQQLHNLARQALEESLDEIDDETLAALKEARLAAVAVALSNSESVSLSQSEFKSQAPFRLLVGSGAIAAVFALFVVWQEPATLTPTGMGSSGAIPQLSSTALDAGEVWEVDEELLDDLEFYAWLDRQDGVGMDETHAG